MARRKTTQEAERFALAKSIRSFVRLKYALAADEEINEVLFDILDQYDAALGAGEAFDFSLSELVDSTKRLK
ncbi:hypothetical protein LCGC14_1779170 [marine sediment metagenome]|uniref:Uncharacterized protein n=1 Tax=marine sediment metagenome TaxID=412755 RepID=A0A0F9GW06_9ZZZZ